MREGGRSTSNPRKESAPARRSGNARIRRKPAAAPPVRTPSAHVPVATYRLQMNRSFPFRAVSDLAEYFRDLGITDLYLSPIFRARAGSRHGYDIVDSGSINPELGTRREFSALSEKLRQTGLEILLDIVPNHMAAVPENPWWRDILEHGRSSPFAAFFDIDFHPPQPGLEEQVLLPILGEPFGRVLEGGRLRIDLREGAFGVQLEDHWFPLSLRSWQTILEPVAASVSDPKVRVELESILMVLAHLPGLTETDPGRIAEVRREKEFIKRRLQALSRGPQVEAALKARIAAINGRVGDPHSFDTLERILAQQPYRMSFWHVAADEINYRRFFDITDLAALRVENPAVFLEAHRLVLELVREGRVKGLRIDHVDGLYEPASYLQHLRHATGEPPVYMVVEKILTTDESLPPSWPVDGTTGYEFLNRVGGLFVDGRHDARFRECYARFTGRVQAFGDVLYESRRLLLGTTMTGELRMLATRLARIARQHRQSRDFTLHALEKALSEVLSCFPVYRTYATASAARPSDEDLKKLQAAVFEAKERNPAIREEIFDYVEGVLAFHEPEGLPEEQRLERRRFALRFQQVTGPMMAKGMEDTAFYRWIPLVSLNEVGGDPREFGTAPDRLHDFLSRRAAESPRALNATTTHDTKRGEDARMRIHALSEIPDEWESSVTRWRALNAGEKTDPRIPDGNEEYLFYQTLLGSWPAGEPVGAPYVKRLQEYMTKALREAKVHTSWIRTSERYERRVSEFIEAVLRPDSAFRRNFPSFAERIARAAVYSSLSQSALKVLAPGIPDFYQGSELWDLRLVDPDNRSPVDFDRRRKQLAALKEDGNLDERLRGLLESPWDGRLKLHVLHRALRLRNALRPTFESGGYEPVNFEGPLQAHAFGFTRTSDAGSVTLLTGRLFLTLGSHRRPPLGRDTWGETAARLQNGAYEDVLTSRAVTVAGGRLPLHSVFERLPVAVLRKRP